ncbi:hypothetical protein DRJ12_04475, partial [Candidatus Acetothermia bacterium]
MIDQTLLPERIVVLRLTNVAEVAEAIRTMRVRGAPAIGITAAYGMVLGLERGEDPEKAAEMLRGTRPTAVNLAWAIERMLETFARHKAQSADDIRAAMLAEARRIHSEDIAANRRIGRHGAELLPAGARVMTICNTGALATGGYGTAYGVLRELSVFVRRVDHPVGRSVPTGRERSGVADRHHPRSGREELCPVPADPPVR